MCIEVSYPIDDVLSKMNIPNVHDVDALITLHSPLALNIDAWHELQIWSSLVHLKQNLLKIIRQNFSYSIFLNSMVLVMMGLYREFVYPRMVTLYESFKLDLTILNASYSIFGAILIAYLVVVCVAGIVMVFLKKQHAMMLVLATEKISFVKSLLTFRYLSVVSIFQNYSYSNFHMHEVMNRGQDRILKWQSYLILEELLDKGIEEKMHRSDVFDNAMTNCLKYWESGVKKDILVMHAKRTRFKIKKMANYYRLVVYLLIITFIAVCVNIQLAPMRIMEGL